MAELNAFIEVRYKRRKTEANADIAVCFDLCACLRTDATGLHIGGLFRCILWL